MNNFGRFISFFLVGVFSIGFAVYLIPDQYAFSYQRALVRQYDYCQSIEENKIVFVGGSSLSFGLDLNLMEKLTGRPCAIIGNHAGYGLSYPMEMAKSNLKEGDIVVIEIAKNSIDTIGTELLLTGIGKRYELYQFLLPNLWDDIIEAYPSYVKKNLERWLNQLPPETGPYSLSAYDERGNMTYDRPVCTIPEPFTEEVAKTYQYFDCGDFELEPEFCSYLQQYVEECSQKNVSVYFTPVYALDEAVIVSKKDIYRTTECWKEQLPAPFISEQIDYIFPREYLFNGICHCNTNGAKYRTELLYKDLKPYL